MTVRKKRFSLQRLLMLASFLMFAWLLLSIFSGRSPLQVFKPVDPNPLMNKTPKELVEVIDARDQKYAALEAEFQEWKNTIANKKAKVVVDNETLNMRSKPSLSSAIVLKIPSETIVEIIYYDSEEYVLDGKSGKWCKVMYRDQEGWVWGNYLSSDLGQ